MVLAVLIAVAILGILSTASDYRDGAERARARQQVANALLTDLLSAQSANRAYILLPSGDDLRRVPGRPRPVPEEMARAARAGAGRARSLEGSADAVDRTAQLWFAEAVELIRLRRQGNAEEAIRRINQGLGEARFNAFRAEHTGCSRRSSEVRVDALAANDRRGLLTFAAISRRGAADR